MIRPLLHCCPSYRSPERLQFDKQWGLESDESLEFNKFRNRVLKVVDESVGVYILSRPEITGEFAFLLGVEYPTTSGIGVDADLDSLLLGVKFKDNIVYKQIAQASSSSRLAKAIQNLFWALEKYNCPQIEQLVEGLREAIELSPTVHLRIARRGKTVTLYQGEVKLLDEKVIDETLAWLEAYPNVAKHLEEALRIYQSKDVKKYRNLLDNLRVAIEQLLREILGNKKSLENQKETLLRWLKEHNIHEQVIAMHNSLLFGHFVQYQNDAVKHGEKWDRAEVEFMIYLTGTFTRFLLSVHEEGKRGD